MEAGQVDDSLREGSQAGRELGPASPEAPGRLRAVRKTSRGHRAPTAPSCQPSPAGRYWQGKVLVDGFSGSGAISAACLRQGCPARGFDSARGADEDLCRRCVRKRIQSQVLRREVVAASLAPPCGSWGVAAERGGQKIRSKSQPWGLPLRDLTTRQRERLLLGNRTFRAALWLLRMFCRASLPVMIEHPVNSRIWHTPDLISLAQRFRGLSVTLDQCGYGARWRKRTKLFFFQRLSRGPLETYEAL